jgi:hypothetical protein
MKLKIRVWDDTKLQIYANEILECLYKNYLMMLIVFLHLQIKTYITIIM